MNKPIKLTERLIESLEQISDFVNSSNRRSRVKLEIGGKSFELPSEFATLLVEVAEKASVGSQIQIIGSKETLTTQQAADYLGYSRPTLIKLLDEYKISITFVGKHRRIQLSELYRLENQIRAERKHYLEEMAKEDYELGKLEGFDPVKNACR